MALILVSISLLLLYLGRFIQFNDISGSGAEDWRMPLWLGACVAAFGGLGVAIQHRMARRTTGFAIAALEAGLLLGDTLDEGFRFIWSDEEGLLSELHIALGFTAGLLLLLGMSSPSSRPGGPQTRTPRGAALKAAYAAMLAAATYFGFRVGGTYFDATECGGGDCELGTLTDAMWAGAALVAGLVGIAIAEVWRVVEGRRY